jgi:alkanesulfonate monooxygenase SsuD/methylene tetrahydromethanopterin reductase-like flavin-dependent oxidoreductase (luciferase family)
MKFGMLVNTQDPPDGKNIAQLYQEVLREAELAEQVGFDSVFVPEHHMIPDGYLSSPPTLMAAIAARTQRIRIGSSILQIPQWHPIHVAEAWAVLDNISNGRAILGCGLGLVEAEFKLFGKKIEDAVPIFNEQIEILKQAWKGETFSFRGKFFQFENVRITPLTVQKPRPPIWIGSMSEPALKRAGRVGDGWISDPLHHINVMKSWCQIYKKAAAEHGNRAEAVLIRDCWVAETRKEVEEVWWPALRAMHLFYKNLGFFESGRFNTEWEPWVRTVKDEEWTFDRVAPNRAIAGTPSQVVEEVKRYQQEVGCDQIVCYFRHPGGPNHEYTMKCIRMWGEKVIPHVS